MFPPKWELCTYLLAQLNLHSTGRNTDCKTRATSHTRVNYKQDFSTQTGNDQARAGDAVLKSAVTPPTSSFATSPMQLTEHLQMIAFLRPAAVIHCCWAEMRHTIQHCTSVNPTD